MENYQTKGYMEENPMKKSVEFIPHPKQAPQPVIKIETVPIQKYYNDYEPLVEHEEIPYDRVYNEYAYTALGNKVPVTKTLTDYQVLQHTTYRPIQVPYIDYQQIEHRTDYVPKVRYETSIDHVPNQINKYQSLTIPVQKQIIDQYGNKVWHTQNQSQLFNQSKQDFMAKQNIHQIVDYEPVYSSKIISESTVKQPIVEAPQPTSIVIQNSIHEFNAPVIDNNTHRHTQSQTQFQQYPVQMAQQSIQKNQNPIVQSLIFPSSQQFQDHPQQSQVINRDSFYKNQTQSKFQ